MAIDAGIFDLLFILLLAVIIISYYISSFHFALFALFLALSAGFLSAQQAIAGIVCAVTAGIVLLHFAFVKVKEQSEKSGHNVREDLEKEWKKVESAKGQGGVGVKFWDDSLHALGKKSSEILFAKDLDKLSAAKPGSRIQKGSQNFIDGFMKIFKK